MSPEIEHHVKAICSHVCCGSISITSSMRRERDSPPSICTSDSPRCTKKREESVEGFVSLCKRLVRTYHLPDKELVSRVRLARHGSGRRFHLFSFQ